MPSLSDAQITLALDTSAVRPLGALSTFFGLAVSVALPSAYEKRPADAAIQRLPELSVKPLNTVLFSRNAPLSSAFIVPVQSPSEVPTTKYGVSALVTT